MIPVNSLVLDWMIPAPAQGAILVTGLASNQILKSSLSTLNHPETAFCVSQEREFLRTLEGGCTAPIGAVAQEIDGKIAFKGCVTHKEGTNQLVFDALFPINQEGIGLHAAEQLLKQGAKKLLDG